MGTKAFTTLPHHRHHTGNIDIVFPLETMVNSSPNLFLANHDILNSRLMAETSDEEIDEEKMVNIYEDPNYPDLEFIDYSDPEYQIDQGAGDEFFDDTSTEAQVEAMREE